MKGTIRCLHGAVGHATDWLGFTVPGWKVRRIDLWRFLYLGRMPLPEFGRAFNDEVRATPGPHVLLGYSMGGRLALHALLSEDPPWAAAVIVSAHPGLEDADERSKRREMDFEWSEKARHGDWTTFLSDWNAQPVLGGILPGLADRMQLEVRRHEIAASLYDWALSLQEPLWTRLPEIDIPVLWVCGERDGKFRALAERAVPLLVDGQLEVIPNAGHRVLGKRPMPSRRASPPGWVRRRAFGSTRAREWVDFWRRPDSGGEPGRWTRPASVICTSTGVSGIRIGDRW